MSGYRVRNGQWTLIGRQSPQLPQVGWVPFSSECKFYLSLFQTEKLNCKSHVLRFALWSFHWLCAVVLLEVNIVKYYHD